MSRKASRPDENRLLAALPPKQLAALYRRYETVDLKLKTSLSKSGGLIDSAYFPENGMISLVQTLEDGSTIEVGLIGAEGFWGVPLVLGARSSPVEAMVQGAGTALRIPVKDLLTEIAKSEKLRALLLRYAQALLTQVVQTAACNGRHPVQKRLARWLLEAHDRMGSEMHLSHELLAFMLGCRRAGVTVALGKLKSKGAITTVRSHIHINDRKGLENAACECYRTVQAEYRRLLP
jgi:CRP-like cAMP-binding protein